MNKEGMLKGLDRNMAEIQRQRSIVEQVELGRVYEFRVATLVIQPNGDYNWSITSHVGIPMSFNKNSVRIAILASDTFQPKEWSVKSKEWYETKKFWKPIRLTHIKSVKRLNPSDVSLYVGLKNKTPYLERFFKGELKLRNNFSRNVKVCYTRKVQYDSEQRQEA